MHKRTRAAILALVLTSVLTSVLTPAGPARADEELAPLPPFPSPAYPWPEFALAGEIWLSIGGYVCKSKEAILAGSSQITPAYANVMIQAGYQVAHAAMVIADYFPTRVFVDPACDAHAALLAFHPGVRVQRMPVDRIWIRDFAPFWILKRNPGANPGYVAVDLPYFAGQKWAAQADAFPTAIAQASGLPSVRVEAPEYGLQGGDFQADPQGNCFYNAPINNPSDAGASVAKREQGYPKVMAALGCKKVFALDPLPKDGTGHIDMIFMLAPGKRAFALAFDPQRDPEAQAVMERNYLKLAEAGYQVLKLPAPSPRPDAYDPKTVLTYASYANSLLNGNVAFVPQYGLAQDHAALDVYRKAGFHVVPVRLDFLALQNGSIHCVTTKSPFRR